MSRLRGLPTGRAGRPWLARRTAAAQHGAALLDRRLRILRRQQERFAERARQTGDALERGLASAERAALRAALVAGEDALRPPAGDATARVDVEWAALIGARFPSRARVRVAEPSPRDRVPASATVVLAGAAYREVLVAAVEHAVATAAARVVDDEVESTRFRLRAIEDRWLPRLQQARRELDLALAESESGEAVRMRWAAASGGPGAAVTKEVLR